MKQKVIFLAICLSVVFSCLITGVLGLKKEKVLHIYTYQVGIYNEKENALNMINTLSSYGIEGYSYEKNQQNYVVAYIGSDVGEMESIILLLKEKGIEGIQKEYDLPASYQKDFDEHQYSEILKEMAKQ